MIDLDWRQKIPMAHRWLVYRTIKAGVSMAAIGDLYFVHANAIKALRDEEAKAQRVRVWKYLEKRAYRPKPERPAPPSKRKRERRTDVPWEVVRKIPSADHRKLVRRRKNGEQYQHIAATYSVSVSRVRQIVEKLTARQKTKVKAYLFRRRTRKQVWTPRQQWIEFEMMRGEG
jgi:hypothetical protein